MRNNDALGRNRIASFLPKIQKTSRQSKREDWTDSEKMALIFEDGEASNAHKLDIKNTHYEQYSHSQLDTFDWPFGF